MASEGRLVSRTAIVTGASSGLGAAIARALITEGARVVIAARRRDRLEALAADFPRERVLVQTADLLREGDVLALFEAAESWSSVDLLVNNAGAAAQGPTATLPLDDWNQIIGLNLTAAFLCAREAMRRMIPRRRGRIINIGSISGQVPRPHSIAYTTSKFGLEGLTRALALDGREHGITASIVRPGAALSELGGMQPDHAQVGPDMMKAETVAAVVVAMAVLPDEVNLLDATVLPIAQPFLGRG